MHGWVDGWVDTGDKQMIVGWVDTVDEWFGGCMDGWIQWIDRW